MRVLLFFVLFFYSSISWGNSISGKFLCEVEYPDGSSNQYLIEVEKTILILKHPEYSIKNEYRLIFKNSEYNTLVFEMFPTVIFLSPGNKNKEIEFHQYQFYSDSKDEFYHGVCKGPFMD